MPAELDQISPFKPMSEAWSELGEVKDRVHDTIGTLVMHEVEGRFRT
jgi:hypothetical protein